jgi:2-hydroxychromene-2-carboxylate isomerase
MASQIEFCFDFASPYSYLAATQLPALTAATRAATPNAAT